MNQTRIPTAALDLSKDFLSAIDEADFDGMGLSELLDTIPDPCGAAMRPRRAKKVWLHNAAWIMLCLAILAGSVLFVFFLLQQ